MSPMVQIDANAYQFIEAVNSAFSDAGLEEPLSDSMCAEDAIDALNFAFSTYEGHVEITTSMDAEAVIETVNSNLSLIGSLRTVKFLHISDTHNHASADAINYCKSLMDGDNSIEFTFLTGDYTGYNGSYSYMTPALQSMGQKILMLNGNHDVYDGFGDNQSIATSYLKSIVVNSDVHWGDTSGVASYYYRDITLSGVSKLRIISVDAYDYRGVSGWSKYDTVYSQTQVDWIVERMMELRPTDYFIIAMHEPPVNASTANYSYNVSGRMDSDIVALRRSNNFCSARLFVWDTSLSNGNLFPMLVDAYTNKRTLSGSVANTNTLTGATVSSVMCDYDFSSVQPATFLFYMGGHLHGDFVGYHPSYQDQPILLVDCGNSSTLGNSSDIGTRASDTSQGTRSSGVLANMVILDFANREINITRVGQNEALSYNGFPALTRTNIRIRIPFITTIPVIEK